MLLDWLGRRHGDQGAVEAAVRLEDGVRAAVRGGVSTRDLGGTASTSKFTDAVVRYLAPVGTVVLPPSSDSVITKAVDD
jgi:3-isopropylmalate dehydrogenase